MSSLLPTPSNIIKQVNHIIFSFLWKGKDKMTRLSAINTLEEGGIKMIDHSAHLDCLHTVTNRYSPVLIGPQKSTATSFQGSLDMGVMRNGSLSCDMLTTWHRWQCWMCTSTILSSPGNHTLVRRYSLVLVIPWWPSCASLTTLSRIVLGTTIRGPRTTSPPTNNNNNNNNTHFIPHLEITVD